MNLEQDNFLLKKIDKASNRIHSLYRSAAAVAVDQPLGLDQCLEELGSALEELYTAEEELRKTNEDLVEAWSMAEQERHRYKELFEFAPDAYLVTTIDGKIKEANRAALNLFQLSHRKLINTLVVNFVCEREKKNFDSVLTQLPTLNRVQELELHFSRQKSEEFYGAATVEIIRDLDDEISGLRWLIRDITSRKQAEEKLAQVQLQNLELIETDRLKSQFMSTISHELRTPLNAILGFSQLLMMRLQKQEGDPLVMFVERILRNGKNLLSLIEDLLDFTKLESHCLELRRDRFDLVEIAKSTCEELRALADQKALELRLDVAQPQLLMVNDCHRIRQILVNLLSNAIKFTEKGSVVLEVGEVSSERVTMIIKDTGIGIDEAHLPHIFREFWQANQTITRKYNGTGLGLAITQSLVKLMNGTIRVKSEVGAGTIFIVEIPRTQDFSSCSSINKITP